MAGRAAGRTLRVRAFAKINLTLRVLGLRPDGYHDLRTIFQSIALHDTLTFTRAASCEPFRIECDDPACPVDDTNLVRHAVDAMWCAAGKPGRPAGIHVRLAKRIPLQAGLGGGSSDAAAALRACAALWRVSNAKMREVACTLGADVPFFLEGGTVLGLGRGDQLQPLADRRAAWVALVFPSFGVSTKDAYGWLDEARRAGLGATSGGAGEATADADGNDLQGSVGAHHPEILRIVGALERAGAAPAGMSGSGSGVFGLFGSRANAVSAARSLAGRGTRGRRTLVTRTLGRAACKRRSQVA